MEVTLFGFDFQIDRRMAVPDPPPIVIEVPLCPKLTSAAYDPEGAITYKTARYDQTLMPGIYVRVK